MTFADTRANFGKDAIITEAEYEEMRRYAREEAEQAGLSPTGIERVVDIAVGNAMATEGRMDWDYFEDLTAGAIQGYAEIEGVE